MPVQDVLGWYEAVLSLTAAMLDAARRGDWDALVRLEGDRAKMVDQIRGCDPDPGRDPATQGRKRQIIGEVLKQDEQIQLLTQDWMHELRDVLNSVSTEQRLNRTYRC